eukprot:10720183-Alexandrium_andersonii.AAC.1
MVRWVLPDDQQQPPQAEFSDGSHWLCTDIVTGDLCVQPPPGEAVAVAGEAPSDRLIWSSVHCQSKHAIQ